MEDFEDHDRDIAYSRTVKAGKRIYYLDVKRSRNGDLYLSLTESKKKISGNPENPDVSFEKHKIFLYREDLSKFTEALIDVICYIKDHEDGEDSKIKLNKADIPDNFPEVDSTILDTTVTLDDEPPIKLDLTDFE
jgi:hypothetical protein